MKWNEIERFYLGIVFLYLTWTQISWHQFLGFEELMLNPRR